MDHSMCFSAKKRSSRCLFMEFEPFSELTPNTSLSLDVSRRSSLSGSSGYASSGGYSQVLCDLQQANENIADQQKQLKEAKANNGLVCSQVQRLQDHLLDLHMLLDQSQQQTQVKELEAIVLSQQLDDEKASHLQTDQQRLELVVLLDSIASNTMQLEAAHQATLQALLDSVTTLETENAAMQQAFVSMVELHNTEMHGLKREINTLMPADSQQLPAHLQSLMEAEPALADQSDNGAHDSAANDNGSDATCDTTTSQTSFGNHIDALLQPGNPDLSPLDTSTARGSEPEVPMLSLVSGASGDRVLKVVPFEVAGTSGRKWSDACNELRISRRLSKLARSKGGRALVPLVSESGVRRLADGRLVAVLLMRKEQSDAVSCLRRDMAQLVVEAGSNVTRLVRRATARVAWYSRHILEVVTAIHDLGYILNDIKGAQFVLSADGSHLLAIDTEAWFTAQGGDAAWGNYADHWPGMAPPGYAPYERLCAALCYHASEKSDAFSVSMTVNELMGVAMAALQGAMEQQGLPHAQVAADWLQAAVLMRLAPLLVAGAQDEPGARMTVRAMQQRFTPCLLEMEALAN